MAASLGRVCKSSLLKTNYGVLFSQPVHNFSTANQWSKGRKVLLTCLGVAAGGLSTLIYALENSVKANEAVAHPPHYKWSFSGFLQSLDHASMRRGWEVYKNVCSACHSIEYLHYRQLVNVTHTEDEAKALAAEVEVRDGPDSTGQYYMRPGKLADPIPQPYDNEEAARAANNGALPPDLSNIVNARELGADYVFSLLTGYCEAPAGVALREGQYFNPYFPGGALGMGQVIFDEVLDYSDGTPATASQVAKDVTTFLMWVSNREHDDRQRMALKAFWVTLILAATTYVLNKQKWSVLKSTKIIFKSKK